MLRHVSPRRRTRARATTLLEVVVGAALIAFALVAALDSVESVGRMNELHVQQRRALEVAQSKIAYLRSIPFSSVKATVAACSTLTAFAVPDLPPRRNPGAQGVVTVFFDETGGIPSELGAVGGKMDLDGDGLTTTVDVTSPTFNAWVLPVEVKVTWGAPGNGKSPSGKYPEYSTTLYTILNAGDSP